jgi:hypothetical protein
VNPAFFELPPLEQHKLRQIPEVLDELDVMERECKQTISTVEFMRDKGIIDPETAQEMCSVSAGHVEKILRLRTDYIEAQQFWGLG